MKTCECSGNHSLRPAIGSIRCECGGALNAQQVMIRVIARLDDCDEQNSRLIQALVAAGMDECDICGEWYRGAEIIRAGDRSSCYKCFDAWHFIREDDDDATVAKILRELIRATRGRKAFDMLPRERDGKLMEPFLTEYKRTAP